MIRRNLHKWHRVTSLIVMVPVLLWTISGFLHPVMGSFKPAVRNQTLPATVIDTSKIQVSLQQALLQNGLQTINNFRIIQLGATFYYQVQIPGSNVPTYISCQDGTVLESGDRVYAAFLAQRFLSEPMKKGSKTSEKHHHHATAGAYGAFAAYSEPNNITSSPVTSTKLITEFGNEYKASNKLLPVYRVGFDREDNIRLYVETSADRLALALDDRKAYFNQFFAYTHSWSFLNGLGKTKSVLLGAFSALSFFTSLFGFYLHYISNRKKIKPISFTHKNRKWHRTLGTVFLTTTLLYSFSGAWHAWNKLPQKPGTAVNGAQPVYAAAKLDLSFPLIFERMKAGEELTGISMVKIEDEDHWQVSLRKGDEQYKRYVSIPSNKELEYGDEEYAANLACNFSGMATYRVVKTENVTSYNHSYSMMNKRLPVVEVSYDNGVNYFIETTTGKLAAVTRMADRMERFSFSNLHMHHYWEMWLGKESGRTVRNLVLMLSTSGLLMLALTGTIIYFKKKTKRPARL